MFYIFMIVFAFYFILTLISIIIVLQEEVLYSKKQKCLKIMFILFVPFIGALIELYKLGFFKKKKNKGLKNNSNKEARYYEFFNEENSDIVIIKDSTPL